MTDEGILIRPVDGHPAAGLPSSGGAEEKEPPAAKQRGLRGWWARGRKR